MNTKSDVFNRLKRISIPTFTGDKRTYEQWKAAFITCIDSAPISAELKLLQLREYVAGEALQCIQQLGYSANAYEKAKEKLDRKFGGERRRVAVQMEELERFPQMQRFNAKDLERLADLLDVAVVNLKDAGRSSELGNGIFYARLLTKLSKSMLAQYQRWLYEHRAPEQVEPLLEWLNLEAEFL